METITQAEIMFTEKAFQTIIIEEMAKGNTDKESLIAIMSTQNFDQRVKELASFFMSKLV